MNKRIQHSLVLTLCLLGATLLFAAAGSHASGSHAAGSRSFPETGHTVQGVFLAYWEEHGGLAQQGYPITEQMQEQSEIDGKTYTVQYFERAVFEMHPENKPPYNVLLSLLGSSFYKQRYPSGAPGQQPNGNNPRRFPETGKSIGGAFRAYWEEHGGLAQQGYPVSDEFQERSQIDGKMYTVQYFERAVFEMHPEFAGTASEVELSLLGALYFQARHGVITEPSIVPQQPTATPLTPDATATAGAVPVGSTVQMLFLKGDGSGQLALIDSRGGIFPQKRFDLPSHSYTAIESLGGGYVLGYDPRYSGSLGQVDEQGAYHAIAGLVSLGVDWTRMTTFANTIVLYSGLVNPPNGLASVQRLKVPFTGAVTTQKQPLFNRFDMMAATSDGIVVTYWNGATHPVVATWRIEADGSATYLHEFTNLAQGYDHILRLYNNDILLYNSADGSTFIGTVKSDGVFSRTAGFKMAAGWTSLSVGTNDILVTYNRNNGVLYTVRPDYQGNRYSILNVYGPGGPVDTNCDFVLSLR